MSTDCLLITSRGQVGTASACTLEEYEATASYSAILFGPPGTAKTTVVAAIAKRLGWGFVTVDTSTFLRDGLTNVARRISDVFDQLMRLDKVVILFDEIEEFVLDRSISSLTMESRLLTTAMLTKLADLRGQRKAAFFIATNRLSALDAAVTRPGRWAADCD
jgi:SpoVK/Ycf46/Vps4 family AAA+-type ATPase